MPLVRGSWVSVMLHEKFAADGSIEVWVNGRQVNFFGSDAYNPNHVSPTQRLEMQTMDTSNNGGRTLCTLQAIARPDVHSVPLDQGPLTIGPRIPESKAETSAKNRLEQEATIGLDRSACDGSPV